MCIRDSYKSLEVSSEYCKLSVRFVEYLSAAYDTNVILEWLVLARQAVVLTIDNSRVYRICLLKIKSANVFRIV